MEYNGPNPRDIEEGIRMQKYTDWYNSDDPEAIAKRKSDEEKQRQYIIAQKQEELDYVAFLKENPEVVQKCKDKAIGQLDGIIERYLRAEFENNKLKVYIRNKYK